MPSPQFERLNDMSKLRVVVDIDIDDERCAELGVTEDTLVKNICVLPDDAVFRRREGAGAGGRHRRKGLHPACPA